MTLDPSSFSELLSSELEDYLEYNMGLTQVKRLLPADGRILQTNGPWLEFTRRPVLDLGLTDFVKKLNQKGLKFDPDLALVATERIPGGRLYRHQEAAIEAILAGKNVVLPHPTGSGKTEAFLLPILHLLLHEIRTAQRFGLGCVMVFPMKALENDQRDRLKGYLFSLENKLDVKIPWIGVYDGDTPSKSDFAHAPGNDKREEMREYRELCPKCGNRTLHYNMGSSAHLLRCDLYQDEHGNAIGCGYPEDLPEGIPWIRTTREDMRSEHYPNLLITNPEALDYRLLSYEDRGVFRSKMERVVVVVDEAHAYSASSALALRFILSRLEEMLRKVNGNPTLRVQYVISSATLDSPADFAKRLVPWADFEVIPFDESKVAFETSPKNRASLLGPIGLLDPDNSDPFFQLIGVDDPQETLGKLGMAAAEAESFVKTALNLGLLVKDHEVLNPGSERVSEAFQLHQLGRVAEARASLTDAIKDTFLRLDESIELYEQVRSGSKRLDSLSEWWMSKWNKFSPREAELTITALVHLGRRLEIWEERWHTFLKAPTGAAACTGKGFHFYRLSDEEQLPSGCSTCSLPVLELWTCTSCGELYFVVYRCSVCATLHAIAEQCCGKLLTDSDARVVHRGELGEITDILQMQDHVVDPKEGCVVCSGDVLPIRRRTEQVIDLSVSLMGWYVDEKHRKFLLFTDSRAASERVARDFNNIEEVLWAERLLYDILANDPTRPKFTPRNFPEVRKRLFSRLYTPYQVLRRLLRYYERDLLEDNLRYAAHRALGRSISGSSRLFGHGLVGYALDEFSERMNALGLAGVLPRVLDILRRKEVYEKGLKKERLIALFLAEKGNNEPYKRKMAELAGPHREKVELALDVLEDSGWIRRHRVGTLETIFMGTGETGEAADPYSVPRDIRKITVPTHVWRCRRCGTVSWYISEVCEQCGETTVRLSHEDLLKEDYFARILAREPRALVAAIHRAGLGPAERKYLEERFRSEKESVHLLSATPTLELGIDIGSLNFVLLAGIPPTRTSYIQRVGRAGRRRKEGAVCATFSYPTPVDRYYFRNPQPLISMKAGHIPVQKLSRQQVDAHLWSTVFDAMTSSYSDAMRRCLVGGIPARDFLDGTGACKVESLRVEIEHSWDAQLYDWIRSVGKRCLLAGIDPLSPRDIDVAVDRVRAIVSDPKLFSDQVAALPRYQAHKSEVEKLHTQVRERLLELQRKAARSADEQREMDRLEKEDSNLKEYKKSEMINAPLLMYLHGVGVLPTARGIGGSVPTYDLTYIKRTVDDREVSRAVADRFPGALVSRQGSIYRIKKMVYDPTRVPVLTTCKVCEQWLADGVSSCPEHPDGGARERRLQVPVVSFALITRSRTLETRSSVNQLIRPAGLGHVLRNIHHGNASLAISKVQTVDVATWCDSYDLFEGGKRIGQDLPILECGNCGREADGSCCGTPSPTAKIQGLTYSSRGFRIAMDELATRTALESTEAKNILGPLLTQGRQFLAQSLANACLNSIATVLEVEPSMLDAAVSSPASLWIFEPIAGGYGILDDLVPDEGRFGRVIEAIVELIRTRDDHSCARYCDQCLIVPRYSHAELEQLHRPLLEWFLAGASQ